MSARSDRAALSRRRALGLFGALGAASLAGGVGRAASPEGPLCVVTPAETEGPFFVDERLNRSDLRTGTKRPGVAGATPLQLHIAVYGVRFNMCEPLAGAQVDIWHTDALGLYSDVPELGTAGQKFLRGYQLTDGNGRVAFTTVYPGWYRGRAVHVHFKVRTVVSGGTAGIAYAFTSQLFMPEHTTDAVFASAPYDSRGPRDMTNAADAFYDAKLLLAPAKAPHGAGYTAAFNVGLKLG